MTVYLLPDEPFFPPVDEAEPDGLIAVGGDLSVERLVQAYSHGIFPWFREGGDVFWFSPNPRMVLYPDQLVISVSLKRTISNGRFTMKFDNDFEKVINCCAAVSRPGQDGTWISRDFISAYIDLHAKGFAHSVEVYSDDELVGGLYGVSLGAAFFGESMFFHKSNASKVAFYELVVRCRKYGFTFIDCQIETLHLQKFGASLIDRKAYMQLLENSLKHPTIKGPWL